MDHDQMELFVSFLISCAEFEVLELDDEQHICLLEECLVFALFLSDKVSQGLVHFSLGGLYRKKNHLTKAIQCYKSYLRAIDVKEAAVVVHMILGNIYHSLREYQEAIEYFNSGLDIAVEIGDKYNQRFAIHNLGGAYHGLGDNNEAMRYYELSLNIAKEESNKRWEMEAYENLGAVCLFSSLSRYHDAIEYSEKCLAIATEINDRNFEERSYRNLGMACQKSGQLQDSIRYCKKHLEIAMETGDKNGEERDYFILGDVSKALGKYHEAIEYYRQYLDVSREIGHELEEEDACGKLAIACRSLGRYNEAMQYHEKVLAIARKTGDKRGEGLAIGSLGNTYAALGKYQEAMECAEKSLTIAKDIRNREVERNALGQLGNFHHELHEFRKGIEYHEQCLEIDKEIGDKDRESRTYGNLGSGYLSLREYEKAIEYHEKNMKMVIETGDKQGQVICGGNLGNDYRLVGMYEKSINSTQKSHDLAKEIDDKAGQGGALFLLAHCYYVLSHNLKGNWNGKDRLALLKESEKYLKESLESYEWMFNHLEEQDQFKISIVDTFSFAYRLLTAVLIEQQQDKEALLVSERGRARALSDLLTTKYNMDTNIRPRRVLKYGDVESMVTTPLSCILFFGVVMQPHKSIDNYVTEGGVVTWLLTVDSPPFITLNSKIEEVEEFSSHNPADDHVNKLVSQAFKELKVRDMLGCEDRSLDNNIDVRCIEDVEYCDYPLETLFDMLVAPVQDKLTQDEIIIIPDGRLFTVPYAALKDPKTKSYLSENKRVRLAPSLTTLKILKESSADYHNTTGALIVGDPEVGKVMFRDQEKYFGRLPGAKLEAETIGEMLGVLAITGQQATKQAIIQKLQEGVAVVHFAAHGSTEGEIALTSNISKVDGSIPQEADYLLTMKEVQEIGIKAQLVVLSCCHSGRGEIKAEGVVGMSRAFLAAGARAVVGSLWAIADQATRVFMERFYSHLKQGESACTSLHKAMQDMRDGDEYSEPRFWAPFFLIGDDVTISL